MDHHRAAGGGRTLLGEGACDHGVHAGAHSPPGWAVQTKPRARDSIRGLQVPALFSGTMRKGKSQDSVPSLTSPCSGSGCILLQCGGDWVHLEPHLSLTLTSSSQASCPFSHWACVHPTCQPTCQPPKIAFKWPGRSLLLKHFPWLSFQQKHLSTVSLSSVSPPKPHPSLLPAHRSLQLTSMSLLVLLSLHGIPTPHPFFLHPAKLYFLFRFSSDTTSSRKSPLNTSPVSVCIISSITLFIYSFNKHVYQACARQRGDIAVNKKFAAPALCRTHKLGMRGGRSSLNN